MLPVVCWGPAADPRPSVCCRLPAEPVWKVAGAAVGWSTSSGGTPGWWALAARCPAAAGRWRPIEPRWRLLTVLEKYCALRFKFVGLLESGWLCQRHNVSAVPHRRQGTLRRFRELQREGGGVRGGRVRKRVYLDLEGNMVSSLGFGVVSSFVAACDLGACSARASGAPGAAEEDEQP